MSNCMNPINGQAKTTSFAKISLKRHELDLVWELCLCGKSCLMPLRMRKIMTKKTPTNTTKEKMYIIYLELLNSALSND